MVERFARCDAIVLMEEAQFTRKGGMNRVIIKTPKGKETLTLPVANSKRQSLDQTFLFNGPENTEKIFNRLRQNYLKAPHWSEIETSLQEVLEKVAEAPNLSHAGWLTMCWAFDTLDMIKVIYRSRELCPVRNDNACVWLSELTQSVFGTDYIQGRASMEGYFQPGTFKKLGIRTWAQNYYPHKYEQFGEGFLPTVSVVDALAHLGIEQTKNLLHLHNGSGFLAETCERTREFD